MMRWQWHQLDHMQIICTSLQTGNHASTPPLCFYRPDALPATQPTASKHWRQHQQWKMLLKCNASHLDLWTLIVCGREVCDHILLFSSVLIFILVTEFSVFTVLWIGCNSWWMCREYCRNCIWIREKYWYSFSGILWCSCLKTFQ